MKALHDFEISVDVIAKHIKISNITIYKMVKDGFNKHGDKEEREPILDEDDRTAIIEAANDNRDFTAAQIPRDEQLNAKRVSASTIERDCSTIMGSSARESTLCKDLSEKNMRERFALAKHYTRWSKARMDKIFYSDEINICLTQNGIQ
jgi:hypothetical protein